MNIDAALFDGECRFDDGASLHLCDLGIGDAKTAATAELFRVRSNNPTSSRSNWSTILSYLKSHESYLGIKQDRFVILNQNGVPEVVMQEDNGQQVRRVKYNRPKALCFDYQMLKDELSLDLETEIMDDDEDSSDDIPENDT